MSDSFVKLDDQPAVMADAAPDIGRNRAVDQVVLTLIIVAAVARVAFIIIADPVDLTFRSTDDSYYYYNVARHIVAGDGVTFDGINSTNGFHPLWMLMLLPVFATIDEPILALRVAFVLVTMIAALGFVAAYRCLCHWTSRSAAMLGVFAMTAPFFLNPMINGLETGLLILAIFTLIRADQRWTLLSPGALPPADAPLGVLLAFIFLSRLDGVFIVLATFAAVVLSWLGHAKRPSVSTLIRKLIVTGGVALIVVAPYLIWNIVRFGHMVPISGALKSTFPQVSFSAHRLEHLSTRLGLMQIALSTIAIVVCVSIPASKTITRCGRRIPAILWVLYAAALAHLANSLLFMNWAVHWWHYASYAPMTVVLVAVAFDRISTRMNFTTPVSACFVGLVAIGSAAALYWDADSRGDHHQPWIEAAYWSNAHLPPDAVVGMTDCGLFGYFCDRPTVNLDGVINGYEYQSALRDGRLSDYLSRCKVTHIADYEVRYRDDSYRIRLPARLHRTKGGAIFATRGAEIYSSDAYDHAMNSGGIHFAIWPLDRLRIVDDMGKKATAPTRYGQELTND